MIWDRDPDWKNNQAGWRTGQIVHWHNTGLFTLEKHETDTHDALTRAAHYELLYYICYIIVLFSVCVTNLVIIFLKMFYISDPFMCLNICVDF